MTLSSFFSSFVGTIHADAPEESKVEESKVAEAEPQEVEEAAAEAEGEDPEDIHPQLREEAQESSKCKAAAQHFSHCQEKVQSGKGFKHEDCNELAPKLFAKLR
ncbi:Non-heme 11 kDa protein of cytochrome bc1 complex [Lactarius hengduanensis]|nr:Non-heme 11 kDa protein of cytochrome bc1 complex [Lactarius hengduanensis]